MNPTAVQGLLRGITNKDQKAAVRRLLKQGWSAQVARNNHVLLVHESGARFQTALTGGSGAAKRTLKMAERALAKKKGRP